MSSPRSRRAVQAEETQRLILEAALRLFASKGYGGTSIPDIAAEAGVAVPTVYTSVGPKTELLRRLLDWIDQRALIQPLVDELGESEDPERVLALELRITRRMVERCGDVLAALASAAQVEPELAPTYQAGLARHREGARATAARLGRLGTLTPGLTEERAAAMIATLTLPAVWTSLRHDFGWSFDAAEEWLLGVLRARLLAIGQSS